MTAVASSVFTAAQFNTFVRDNLSETAPAKATTPGSHFVTSDTNQISESTPQAAYISTSEVTTAPLIGAYGDLATTGPTVTVNVQNAAFVAIYSNQLSSAGIGAWMSYDVSGASSVSATDDRSIQFGSTGGQRAGAAFIQTGLTPGSTTFTAKYRVSTSGTATFSVRRIAVIPF